jgi:serine/threonine protein kinase
VEDKTFTFCGTPNYVAPEVVSARGHGVSCDNWSLGVLIYELIDGENPFWTDGMDQETLYELIRKALYYPLPDDVSPEARDLVGRLLERDPSKRLGSFREKDILEHKWFAKFDLKKLRDKFYEAPWIPDPISLVAKEEED